MPVNILLVEDNAGDARLLRELLVEINTNVRVHVAPDGLDAMAFLGYQGQYLDAPRPDIILLDLNMPRMDGLEFLVEVKQNPRFKTIPIIVLTASTDEGDIAKSYKLMANCYLRKPSEFKELEALAHSLNDFWLTKVALQKKMQSPVNPLS